MAQQHTTLELGTNVNGYLLESVLGEGGMATVYRAKQISLNRPVALKVLHPSYSQRGDFVGRFEQEAAALAQLQHPNIVAVIDRGAYGASYYFVMEYVEGSDLDHLLAEFEFDTKQIVQIINEVGKGIAYVHQQGIVHRDMKPANILIGTSGVIKVSDFGIAQIARGTQAGRPVTGEGQAMGTGVYMAPEQMANARDVDHRADIYALGATFYKLITRRLPMGSFPMPSEVRADIPKGVDDLVRRALDPDPALRPQNVRDFCRDMIIALQPRASGSGEQRQLRESRVASSEALGKLRAAAQQQQKSRSKAAKKKKGGLATPPPAVVRLVAGLVAGCVVAGGLAFAIHVRVGGSGGAAASRQHAVDSLRRQLDTRRERIVVAEAVAAATPAPRGDAPPPDDAAAPPGDLTTPIVAPHDGTAAPIGIDPAPVPGGGTPTDGTTPAPGAAPPAHLLSMEGMVAIDGGFTVVGHDADPIASPVRRARVNFFFIDRTEVSNADYAPFVATGAVPPPAHWGGMRPPAHLGPLPVHGVSRDEAAAFAAWINKRLPTEEEWERAATNQRARSTRTLLPWGDEFLPVANVGSDHLEPTGAPTQDATRDGDPILRLGGNVAEWTSSAYRPYDERQQLPDGDGSFAVIRGGAAYPFTEGGLVDEEAVRTSRRAYADPRARIDGVGFRCVRDYSLAPASGF